jgi:hypothetical protein
VLLILVLAVALGSPLAAAKKKHKKKGKSWATTVTLSHTAPAQFTGAVGSKLNACLGSRVVTLYYTDPNTGQTQPLSVQRTDGQGGYQVNLTTPAYAGTYQVIVDERKIRAMKAKQTCKGVTGTMVVV